jgi:toxin HigB-1
LTLLTSNVNVGYVIRSFSDGNTQKVWELSCPRGISKEMAKAARRKMQILDAAENINDLRVPPGNRLEKLQPPREGQHSIRIDDRYRICFAWSRDGADDVELVDYH